MDLLNATNWMRENLDAYDAPFDLAVDCAYSLDLCTYCEINGDNTFIPQYLVELAESFFAP